MILYIFGLFRCSKAMAIVMANVRYCLLWCAMAHAPCTLHTHTHGFSFHFFFGFRFFSLPNDRVAQHSAFKHLHAEICNFIVYFIFISHNHQFICICIWYYTNFECFFSFQLKVETICYNVGCWIPNWIQLDCCISCMFFLLHFGFVHIFGSKIIIWIEFIQLDTTTKTGDFSWTKKWFLRMLNLQCIQTIGLTIESII